MYLEPKPDGPARGFKPTPLTWRSTGRAGIQLLSRFSQSTYGCLQPCISSPASRTSLITPSTSRSTQACPPGSLRRWHRAMVNAQVNRRAATDAHTQEARVPFESLTWLTMATIQPTLRGGRVANSPDHRSEPPTRGRHWHRFSSREQKPYWSGQTMSRLGRTGLPSLAFNRTRVHRSSFGRLGARRLAWTLGRTIAALVLVITLGTVSKVALTADTPKGAELSKAEATVIANRFFANEIAMEGSVAEPSLRGDHWVFPFKVGYAGVVARDPILVNRYTGQVSWAGLADHKARSGRGKAETAK